MNKYFYSIVVFIFLSSCNTTIPKCNKIELQIKEICTDVDTSYYISLDSLTNFEWDNLYVIGGPTVDNEVEEFIGISYKKVIQDNKRQFIFTKNQKIIKEYSSYCDLNLIQHQTHMIGTIFHNTSVIQVQKKQRGEHFIYYVDIVE